jgi:hypothetical protein
MCLNQKVMIKKLLPKFSVNLERFLVLDIETIHLDGQFIPYAIGLAWGVNYNKFKIFYLADYSKHELAQASHYMMIDFIAFLNNLSSDKVIFAHNMGNFDGYFVLNGLLKNLNKKVELLVDDQNSLIYMSFKNDKNKTISFKDSFRLLPDNLNNLSKIYDVNFEKLEMNHDIITADMILKDSDFQKRLLEYLKHDLLSLKEIIGKASKYLNEKYKIDFISCFSSSSLAMKIYRTQFMKKSIPLLPRFYD